MKAAIGTVVRRQWASKASSRCKADGGNRPRSVMSHNTFSYLLREPTTTRRPPFLSCERKAKMVLAWGTYMITLLAGQAMFTVARNLIGCSCSNRPASSCIRHGPPALRDGSNSRWPVDLGVNAFLIRQWASHRAPLRVHKRQGDWPMDGHCTRLLANSHRLN
jgi:hypothetical protein